jgi:hypothetical protein
MMIFLQDRRGMREKKRKEKKTELEKPTGICTKLSLRIKSMKEERKERLRQLFFYFTVREEMNKI